MNDVWLLLIYFVKLLFFRNFANRQKSYSVKMKKYVMDLRVAALERFSAKHVLLRLTADDPLPEMLPGQFVEVRIDGTPEVMLRRPISVNYVDREQNELWLLVAAVGNGTRWMATLQPGCSVNCVLPLGNSFTMPADVSRRHLLVGGGVGVAPLYYLGAEMQRKGIEPTFLLGARTAADLLEIDRFERLGRVFVTTEDGSRGERGFVTQHSLLQHEQFDFISTCGPKPMMVAVARYARQSGTPCEVSLENMMACGLGACLCCVEKTKWGNLRVCEDGPVFDIKELLWE